MLNTPPWLLEIIQHGFCIPFHTVPPRMLLQNNKSALDPAKTDWLRNTLTEYLKDGFIKIVDTVPYCVLPLQLKESSDKTSLIFDMSPLNDYVSKAKFKLEGWQELFDYSTTANFGIKFDIRKYYYCIDIKPSEQKYFGFMYKLYEDQDPVMFT